VLKRKIDAIGAKLKTTANNRGGQQHLTAGPYADNAYKQRQTHSHTECGYPHSEASSHRSNTPASTLFAWMYLLQNSALLRARKIVKLVK
jgi:hypothetical protein